MRPFINIFYTPAVAALCLLCLGTEPAISGGTWTALANPAPGQIQTMLLLTDGTVMAQDANFWTSWYKLTPDTNGSYVNGAWSTIAPMHYNRLYYSSDVLPSGKVFVAGGEYGSGTTNAEVYDPVANVWTVLSVPPGLIDMNNTAVNNAENDAGFMDSGSTLLSNGRVLVAPVVPANFGETVVYDPVANNWYSSTLVHGFDEDEAALVLLPDNSVLVVDSFTNTSERYIPSMNQWVNDSTVPVELFDPYGEEEGAGFLLPNGKAFFIGSTPVTALYTPSGTTSPGTWVAGPPIPNSMGAPDAPSAMMVNGKILCALSPTPSSVSNIFTAPTSFYEYDYSAGAVGAFTQVGAPGGGSTLDNVTFIDRMLDLPDGTVLFTDSDTQLYVYQPDLAPLAAGQPTITGISQNPDGSFLLAGTLLNGITQGAAYGDDAQMNSNYPLVRMTNNATGIVYYARTFNWNPGAVMTGANIVTTDFLPPASAPVGAYSLVVVANGNASAPFPFNFSSSIPVLAVVTNIVSGGNGNGVIDFNECNNLTIVLTNEGGIVATGVEATLSSTTVGAIVAQSTSAYPIILPNGTAANETYFTLSTEPTFICGTPINLTLVTKVGQAVQTNFLTLPSGIQGSPDTFTSSTVFPIPNNIPTPVNSPITVSGLQSVAKMTVSVYTDVQYDAGVSLQLISPNGTTVLLSQQNGGFGPNVPGEGYGVGCSPGSETTFDDAAPISILNGTPPFVGSYAPQQPLSVFNLASGTNLNGIWNLQVTDEFPGDAASLMCWSLNISPEVCQDGGGQCPGADLSLTMSASPNPVFENSNLVYNLTVSNAGPGTADNVIIIQTLPPGVGFVTTSNYPVVVSQSGSNLNLVLGSLPVYASATVSVVTLPTIPGLITSVANVGSQESDPNPNNNTASVDVLVTEPTADLAVTMTGTPGAVLQGGLVTYTINVTNNGPFTANNVSLITTLPANANFISATTSQGTLSFNGAFGTLGNIPVGTNVVVTIVVSPTITGNIVASTTVTLSSTEIDPITFNNSASVSTIVGPAAALGVTAVAMPSPVVAGSNLTYIATISNAGPSAATAVVFSQSLPAGSTFISSSLTGSTVSNNLINATIGNLASGGSVRATNVIKSPTLLPGVKSQLMVSTFSIFGQPGNPNTNNTFFTLQTVEEPPTITIVPVGATVIAGSANGSVGPTGTYVVQFLLQNQGTVPTTNLVATLQNGNGVMFSSGAQTYGTLLPYLSMLPEVPPTAGQYSFTAASSNGGTIIATLQLQDGTNNLGTTNFTFVMPVVQSFWNTNFISIPNQSNIPQPASGPANPYPSTLVVSNVSGDVSTVTVTVSNLFHTYANDIGLLLIGPTGVNCELMAAASDSGMDQSANITFDQNAPTAVPPGGQLVSGTYRPGDYNASYIFSNALAAPYYTNLAVFGTIPANGTWSLYAYDFANGDSGAISNGWGLKVTTITPVNQVADMATSIVAVNNPVFQGNTITYLLTVTNNGPNAANAFVTNILSSGLLVTNMLPPGATNYQSGLTNIYGLGILPSGSGATITNVVTATSNALQTNTIGVGSSVLDGNPGNNTANVVVVVNPPLADLSVGPISALPNPVVVNSNLVYTLYVTNNGPSNAFGVVGLFTNSSTMHVVSAVSSQGNCMTNGSFVTCNLGTISNGEFAVVVVTATATSVGTVTNGWGVSTSCNDANMSNNSTTGLVTVTYPMAVITNGPAMLEAQASPPFNGAINPNQTNTVSFTLMNIGSGSTTNLVATLLAYGGITPLTISNSYGPIAPGNAVAKSYMLVGSGSPGSTITAELLLRDGSNTNMAPVFYTFMIPMTKSYTNSGAIIIPDSGAASPYPSVIQVSTPTNLLVSKVTATLNGFAHSWPHDVEVVLVSPSGQDLALMEHTGSLFNVSNLVLTFDDAAAQKLPQSNTLSSGTFLATEYPPFDSFPGLAPVPTNSPSLAVFNGTNPNGLWYLYVYDDATGNNGVISGGWSLGLTTVSTVSPASLLALGVIEAPNPAIGGDYVYYQITVSNLGPSAATAVYLTNIIPSGTAWGPSPVTLSQGSYTSSGRTATCNLGTIQAGAFATVTIQIIAGAAGTITNTAIVTTTSADLYLAGSTNLFSTFVVGNEAPYLSAGVMAGGLLKLTLTGYPGQNYAVQTSSNLVSWTTISTNSGTFIFYDTHTNAPRRFYRAIQLHQ